MSLVDVTIFVDKQGVDLSLEYEQQIGLIIDPTIAGVKEYFKKNKIESDFFNNIGVSYHLARIGDQPLDPRKTLKEYKVLKGEDLYLSATNRVEEFEPIRDSIPDAIAYFQKKNFSSWENADAAYLIPKLTHIFCIALIHMFGIITAVTSPVLGFPRLILLGTYSLLAFSYLATIYLRKNSIRISYLIVTVYSLLFYIGLYVINRPLNVYQIYISSILLVFMAVVFIASLRSFFVIHAIVLCLFFTAFLPLSIYLIPFIYHFVHPTVHIIVAWAIFVTIILMASSHSMAMMLAKVEVPYQPTTKEAYGKDFADLNSAINNIAIPTFSEKIKWSNQERNVLTLRQYLEGFFIGVCVAFNVYSLLLFITMKPGTDIYYSCADIISIFIYTGSFGMSHDEKEFRRVFVYNSFGLLAMWIIGATIIGNPNIIVASIVGVLLMLVVMCIWSVKGFIFKYPRILQWLAKLDSIICFGFGVLTLMITSILGALRGM